jgi:hypothetical protein
MKAPVHFSFVSKGCVVVIPPIPFVNIEPAVSVVEKFTVTPREEQQRVSFSFFMKNENFGMKVSFCNRPCF